MITIQPWRNEDTITLIQRDLSMRITGEPEYEVEIINKEDRFMRFVVKVETLKGELLWADTTTGSLYRMDGRGFSGTLWMTHEPYLTGRNVPDYKERTEEGKIRVLNALAVTGDVYAD